MKKGILVRQRDATDCGPACLASVAAYYGLHIPVIRIREYAGTDQQGTSLYGLMEASKRLNFLAKGARVLPESLQEIPVPAIFHLTPGSAMQHFVVVYRVGKNRIVYMDPARGKMIRLPEPVFKKLWSGVVLLLMPGAEFSPAKPEATVFGKFLELISPHRAVLLQAFACAVVYTLLGLATSVYLQKIIDSAIPHGDRKLMNFLGLIMLVIILFQMVVGYCKSLIALRVGQQIDARLIPGYYRHLMKLPQSFFDGMQVGEIISRVHDAVRIRTFINDTALFLLVHAMTIILSVAAMFLFNRKLALLMVLMIPVYGILYMISNRINERWQRKIMEAGAGLESHLLESISGIATIRRFTVQEYFSRQMEKRFIPLMRAVYKSGKDGLALYTGSEGSTRLATLLILWAGTYFVMKGELSPGSLLSFYALTGYFTMPVQALIGANRAMQDAVIAADRLFEILDLETEKEHSGDKPAALPHPGREPGNADFSSGNKAGESDVCPDSAPVHSSGRNKIPGSGGYLEFRNVHFRYGLRNKVFNGLNLIIPQNRITAITGESGSGKSTLLALLQGIYPLNGGNIFIDGADIRHIDLCTLRSIVAAVPQQTDLFRGTIASNIALGEESPDMQWITELCRRLGLHEFIEQLPGRYGTAISEQGVNFSGGQKQRLAIARALYRDPEILVLDEATSALDPAGERKVQEALRWFYNRKKTVILITHRLSTLKICHQVVLLKDGKQVAGETYSAFPY